MTIDSEALTPGKRFRHVKRGTVYEIIGTGELQMNCDLSDGSRMVVYRGDDGRMWCREEDEFLDGRFAALDQPAQGVKTVAVMTEDEALRLVRKHCDFSWQDPMRLLRVLGLVADTPPEAATQPATLPDESR